MSRLSKFKERLNEHGDRHGYSTNKDAVTETDEYEEEYEDEDDEDGESVAQHGKTPDGSRGVVDINDNNRDGSVIPFRERSAIVEHFRPKIMDESTKIIDCFKMGAIVLVDLAHIDVKEAQRIIDFVSGATYAFGGEAKEVGTKMYIFVPNGVPLNSHIIEAEKSSALIERFKSAFRGK